MVNKQKNLDFFKLESKSPDDLELVLNRIFNAQEKIASLLKTRDNLKNPEEISQIDLSVSKLIECYTKIKDFHVRIGYLRKERINPNLNLEKGNIYWLINVERLDVLEQANVGSLDGDRKIYGDGEDEGPLTDTVFLYNPNNQIIVLPRSKGAVVSGNLARFLSEMLNEDITFSVVVDPETLVKLNRINKIDRIKYNLAVPTSLNFARDDDRGLLGDLKMAQKLNGKTLKVEIGSPGLDLIGAKNKIKKIIGFDSEVKGVVVEGSHNGEPQILDLIKQRVVYNGTIRLSKGQKITINNLMDLCLEGYKVRKGLIDSMYHQ